MTKVTYIERPELVETLADRIGNTTFDGRNLRIELMVSRPRRIETQQGVQEVEHLAPVARLVMGLDMAAALHKQLGDILGSLSSQGLVKPVEPGPTTKQ